MSEQEKHIPTPTNHACLELPTMSNENNNTHPQQICIEIPTLITNEEKKEFDNVAWPTDDTTETETTTDTNQNPTSACESGQSILHRRSSLSNDSVISENRAVKSRRQSRKHHNKNWSISNWLNIQDTKKEVADPLSFPVSKKYRQSCCSSCRRLCCHTLIDTDDLILRQEREQLRLHMQPAAEEEIATWTDRQVAYVVDCSLGMCCKKPTTVFSYCSPCWKHSVTVWGYRVWQTIIMFLFLYLLVRPRIVNLMCEESTKNFRCPFVQDQFRNSNYTRQYSGGYAGMLNSMKALEESNLKYNSKTFPDTTMSKVFNTSNIDVETGYPQNYEEFLDWRVHSISILPQVLILCMYFCLAFLLPVSFFAIFGMRFQSDDPNEIMFPPLLETKETNVNFTTRGSISSEVSDKTFIYSQSFHFIRPKRFVLQFCLFGMPVMVLGFWPLLNDRVPIIGPLLFGIGAGPPFFMVVVGLFIQVHNATTLANILVELCSVSNLSSEQRQAQFEQWKDYYKTTVGALHIWSWRVTPIIGTILGTIGSGIVYFLVESIFNYTHIMDEPDVETKHERMAIFIRISSSRVFAVLIFTVLLFVITGAMAMVSVRYRRLHLLVATLRLPKHFLEDFQIIQKYNAALTLFDVPITVNTVATILHLLFIQTVLVALSTASS